MLVDGPTARAPLHGPPGSEALARQRARRRRRQMSWVAGTLYTSAAVLVGLSLLLAPAVHRHPAGVAAVVAVGMASGVAWLWMGDRFSVPEWVHAGSGAAGSVLVALLIVAAGPAFGALYGVLLLYVVAFSFYYLAWPVAVAEVVVAGVAYVVALSHVGAAAPVAALIVLMGASVVGAGLIAGLGHRTNQLLDREQVTVTQLSERDGLKDSFLRLVAHDLRSPLATIVGAAELIGGHLDALEPAVVRDLVRRQAQQGRRLARLVSDLLDTERLRSRSLQPDRQPVRLDQLVAHSVELAVEGHPVTLDLQPVEADVDPALIERAVDNLTRNAVRHSPEHAPVEVRLHRVGDGVELVVDDRGAGVPDASKERVFDLFHHGSDHEAGTGVGLALARELVAAHGGRVWVEDRPGGGASFRVWLPNAKQPDGMPQISDRGP